MKLQICFDPTRKCGFNYEMHHLNFGGTFGTYLGVSFQNFWGLYIHNIRDNGMCGLTAVGLIVFIPLLYLSQSWREYLNFV